MSKGFDQWLRASYKYYITYEDTGMSDYEFDMLSNQLLNTWDEWEHPFKHVITKEDLACGSGFAIKLDQYNEYFKQFGQ